MEDIRQSAEIMPQKSVVVQKAETILMEKYGQGIAVMPGAMIDPEVREAIAALNTLQINRIGTFTAVFDIKKLKLAFGSTSAGEDEIAQALATYVIQEYAPAVNAKGKLVDFGKDILRVLSDTGVEKKAA